MSTVGHLVDSQIWTLDKGAAVSAGRQGFAAWLYEQFLPVLWDRWTVLNCQVDAGCSPPLDPNNPHDLQQLAMLEFAPPSPNAGSKKWDGLVPKQTDACGLNSEDFQVCNWQTLEDRNYGDVLTTLRGPVTRPVPTIRTPGRGSTGATWASPPPTSPPGRSAISSAILPWVKTAST